jgi:hypothetical protein
MLITIYLCDFIAMEICVTRFNEATFKENRLWIKKNNGSLGCIYGTPVKISDTLDPDSQLLVLEMNNTKNIIEGIGIIKNNLARENRKFMQIIIIIGLYTNQIIELIEKTLLVMKVK